MGKNLLIVTILVVISLVSWGMLRNEGGFVTITPEQAKEMIDKQDVVVLDVREPGEYAEGHIPGSVLLPLGELPGRWQELDKNATIIVVCRSGNRSAKASNILVEQGFKNVYNMDGGMLKWTYEIEK